jgi:hypothetical protein
MYDDFEKKAGNLAVHDRFETNKGAPDHSRLYHLYLIYVYATQDFV